MSKELTKEEFNKLSKSDKVEYLIKVDPVFAKEADKAMEKFWKEYEESKDKEK
jgi:hypothetical protein